MGTLATALFRNKEWKKFTPVMISIGSETPYTMHFILFSKLARDKLTSPELLRPFIENVSFQNLFLISFHLVQLF